MVARVLLALTPILCGLSAASAQSDIPILSGGAGFFSATQGNNTFFQPVVAPELVVPFGEKWLETVPGELWSLSQPARISFTSRGTRRGPAHARTCHAERRR